MPHAASATRPSANRLMSAIFAQEWLLMMWPCGSCCLSHALRLAVPLDEMSLTLGLKLEPPLAAVRMQAPLTRHEPERARGYYVLAHGQVRRYITMVKVPLGITLLADYVEGALLEHF